jgi:hypothetical protein
MVPSVSDPGSGFRGVLDYDLKPSKGPELLGGNMRGETSRGLATEFGDWRALNEDVTKPVFHCSLSAAPDDKISAERWLDIAADFVKRMGYENSPWVAIRHHDTAIDHIHVVASRIDNDGSYVPNHQEKKRSQAVCRELEKAYDLRQLRTPSRRATPTRDHVAVFERTGSVTVKARLQEHIDLAARDRPTMTVFVERLDAHGIEVRANIAATGHVSGISFAYDGVACKGSDLGRGYSWRQLQERAGITYEAARDLDILRAAAARATTFIAEKKPLVRDPAAALVPPLARPAEAFAQAAVLESRAELTERHQQLTHQLALERTTGLEAHWQLDEGPRLAREVGGHRFRLEYHLTRIYEKPATVYNRLAEALKRGGLEKAAYTLEHRPAELGHLHGRGLGRLETRSRREALAATPEAARELRGLATASSAADAHYAKVDGLVHTIEASGRRAEHIAASLRHLPDVNALAQDLLRAGHALGTSAVNALSAAAVRAFETATRLVGRALGHRHDRGFGPGDDGLGLGR